MRKLKRLKPFFKYFGSKYRSAARYPSPYYSVVIEPFAGLAGYSHLWHDRQIWLVDKNPLIAALWQYLIKVSESEIMRLPVAFDHVDDLSVTEEAKSLIGFWLNGGVPTPRKRMCSWGKQPGKQDFFWGVAIRARVASQLRYIRHWRAFCGSYEEIRNARATWFIDPPYQDKVGNYYPEGSIAIDFQKLGNYCESRNGQVIVCENVGADWLPFDHLFNAHTSPNRHKKKKRSAEALYYRPPCVPLAQCKRRRLA